MAREGLMDDAGVDFEPSEAEEMAWDSGYDKATEDIIKKIEKLIDKNKDNYERGYISYQMYFATETAYIELIEEIRGE